MSTLWTIVAVVFVLRDELRPGDRGRRREDGAGERLHEELRRPLPEEVGLVGRESL